MPKVLTTNTINPATWDHFVERHPLGTIYHHSLWQDTIRKTYGYQPLYHVVVDESLNIQAAIWSALVKNRLTGNRIVSYPFSDTCDPLVSNSGVLAVLLEALGRSRSELNARFVELRFANSHHPTHNNPSRPEYYTYQLEMGRDLPELCRSFHKNCVQRAIKKAKQEQLEILTGENLQDLKTFYRLHIMTRKKHGAPIQPFRFFKNLWNALIPCDMLSTLKGSSVAHILLRSLLLVRYKGTFVAGIIILCLS